MPNKLFDQFKARRELWLECLSGEDTHAIMTQIYRMVWNAAAFRMVNEARRIAPPAEEGGVQVNGMMHRLLDDSFFEGQMLAIRRLTDTYPIEGDRRGHDVFSLTSLLDDMRKHAHLMTRVNIFEAEGRKYDYEKVYEQALAYDREKMRARKRGYWTPEDLHWDSLKVRHEQVDWLAGTNEARRSPGDSVRPAILDFLRRRVIRVCTEVHDYVNKHVAHAATPESRQVVEADAAAITLKHLWDAHQTTCQVANFLGLYLLAGTSYSFLPRSRYDQFAHIDRPLVDAEGVRVLANAWKQYEDETRGWGNWGIEELEQEFGSCAP